MIRPYREPRPRSLAWPVVLGAVAVFAVALGSGLGASLAIEGKAAVNRPIAGSVAPCPAATTERRP